MDDLFGFIFIIIVFVLAPIIEQIRRKNAPPQQRRPSPPPPERPSPQPRQQRSRFEELPARTEYQPYRPQDDAEPAATMVPEDLWAVLTGQPLPAPRQPPRQLPAPEESELESLEGEETIEREDRVEVRRRTFEEAVSLEQIPPREYPVIVSMEEELPDARTRHAAFHKRIEPGLAPRPARPRLTGAAKLFQNPSDVRQAMIYQIIFGPPKGLE